MPVKRIIDLVEDNAPSGGDYVPIDNSSPNSTRRTRVDDLLSSAGSGVFATAAQGLLADTALQPADIGVSVGDMFESVYDSTGKAVNVYESNNHDFLNSGTGPTTRSVRDRLRDTLSVLDFGTVDLTGAVSAQTVVDAAVANALLSGRDVYWPAGTYLTTASIPSFHSVKHFGPGVVKRGSDLWYITPTSSAIINHVYAAASGGSSANDGLSSSQPLDTFQHAIDALLSWSPLMKGQWQIDLAAGTYARGRFPDEGVPSGFPIIVEGPAVSITAGAAFKMSITGRSGTFTLGETITFSTSGATATLTYVDNTKNVLFATLVSGTPVVGQTITGGTSAATAVTDYQSPTPTAKVKEGATAAAVGILGFNTSMRIKNIEVEDYNGSLSSNGIRGDYEDLFLENVHLIDCYYGASMANFGKLDAKGGFAYDCGYLNSSTGGGYAYRGIFHTKFEIGTQGAGDLLSGPAIKGCSATVRGQELSTGHIDYVLQHDNDSGLRLLVNSRMNIGGSSFKRIAGSAAYATQGSYVDPDASTVFGTGVDANGSNYSGGSGSNASGLGIDTFSTANAAEWGTFKSAFPGTVVTSTSSTNTIDSFTLKADTWNSVILSGIAAKKIRLRVWGVLIGTTGTYKRLQLRIGGVGAAFLSFTSADGAVAPGVAYNATLELIFTGANTQYCVTNGAVSAGTGGRVSNTALTEAMTTDKVLAFQAYVQNAADSITIAGYEWEEMGV